jgi:hypothetical protein
MANEIDGELYPDNNAHTTADPTRWRRHPTTGVKEEVPISGLTDLRVYVSLDEAAVDHTTGAIHADLVELMTEIGETAGYEATLDGAALRARVSQPDSTPLFVHWQSPTAGYHEVAQVIWRTTRPAAT